ncbi:LOW QUALITY PROTEIN: UPF0575 protein C19orf67 homolog [Enoplosus armatus]|uniref:LOW QUALITY PROTEIN: UPF0575 protein C19orf67 homolog n=1 Tax=Enoplosus armatus TaxID=215367 RepID=UPI0039943408
MTDIEVQVEVQLTSNSPSGQHAFGDLQEDSEESDCMETQKKNAHGGHILTPACLTLYYLYHHTFTVEKPLSLLADVALAPPCGDHLSCSCLEVRGMERSLQFMQLQLHFLMSKADDLQDCLVNGQGHLESEALAAAVPSFLYTCEPYFNHLESTTRSTVSQLTPLPSDIYTRVNLLDFSQQLCDRLEQLVLTYASYHLLCLDEAEPNSVSHFCIGQSQLGRLKVAVFLYCKPAPYLARVNTGLYKRMRWNVDRLGDEQTDEEQGGESEEDTEYYFLCYEDIPNAHAEAGGDSQGVSRGDVVRMWTIGQWVQVNPDPDTEDIDDWVPVCFRIMCDVPQANYHRLLFLGSDEPSSCSATDYLQQLLLHQTAE